MCPAPEQELIGFEGKSARTPARPCQRLSCVPAITPLRAQPLVPAYGPPLGLPAPPPLGSLSGGIQPAGARPPGICLFFPVSNSHCDVNWGPLAALVSDGSFKDG
jgi:hypothetical protein